METKTYSTTLVLNWKKGTFKAMRRPPKTFKADEIPIDFSLKMNIPDPVKIKAHGEITLSEQKISDIVAEEI